MENSNRDILKQLFKAAVDAADPKITLPSNLPAPPKGRTVVIGCGKGVAQMASALEQSWEGDLSGVVVTRYGFSDSCKKITALCQICKDGTPGIFSYRKSADNSQILIGAKDEYMAVCRKHYLSN